MEEDTQASKPWKNFLQCLFPARQFHSKDGPQLFIAEDRVPWTPGRGRILLRRNRKQLRGGARLPEDGTGKAIPGGPPAAAHMVNSRRRIRRALECRMCRPGNLDRRGRCARLIIDNAQLGPLSAQSQHCQQKIATMRTIDPACPEDEISPADPLDGFFPGQLTSAINIQGASRVRFQPWTALCAVKNIIGGIV